MYASHQSMLLQLVPPLRYSSCPWILCRKGLGRSVAMQVIWMLHLLHQPQMLLTRLLRLYTKLGSWKTVRYSQSYDKVLEHFPFGTSGRGVSFSTETALFSLVEVSCFQFSSRSQVVTFMLADVSKFSIGKVKINQLTSNTGFVHYLRSITGYYC